ncbi:uncharacterized protein [Nothobranchius furzeri]|uniref:uncharacterized protein isoform X3 n=2 Tax=Nothobranchius furzeri TaxID=105023 RepID=UPI0024046568|nr:uncharacterized protein LOC107374401 isoform X3 [Nothobranchius furzeri]
MAMHQTILRRGQDPLQSIKRCSDCCSNIHCTFCKMTYADFYKVKYHVQNHVSIAVKHEDYVILKCSLGCREMAHYHCCYCPSTILRRMAFVKHLAICKEKLSRPPPPAQTAPPPSAQTRPPQTGPPPPSAQTRPPQTGPPPPSAQTRPPQTGPPPPQTGPPPPQTGPPPPQTGPPPPSAQTAPSPSAQTAPSPSAQTRPPQTGPPPPQTGPPPPQTGPPPPSAQTAPSPSAQTRPPQTGPPPPSAQTRPPQTGPPPPSAQTRPPQTGPPPPQTGPPPPQTAPPPPSAQTAPPPSAQTRPPPSAQTGPPPPSAQTAPPPSAQTRPPPPQTGPPPPSAQTAPPPSPQAGPSSSSSSSRRLKVRQPVKVTCSHCGITLNKKNLQVHINRKHRPKGQQISETRHLSCQCIDATNGIFAVNKSFFKPCSPIHVQKKTWGTSQKQICELDDCNTNLDFAVRSGILPYECIHLKSLTFSPRSDTPPTILEEEVLSDIVSAKIFGDVRKQSCLNLQSKSAAAGVPLSVDVTVGGPSSKKFISVFEPKVSCYSRLGRVMVAFDMKKRSWHCPCAKPRLLCLHKSVAKWHLFQTDREMFKTKESATDSGDAAETNEELQDDAIPVGGQQYPPGDNDLMRMVKYIMKNKALPENLPQDLVTGSQTLEDISKDLIPKETICAECGGQLNEPVLITARAKLVAYTGVVHGFSTYRRECPDCGLIYRYQEWSDGIHNFNDHILLTLHLCIYLRNSIQTHHAVSRAIEVLEKTENQTFPSKATMLHAYMHFEALTAHSYSYSCYKCGYYPPVVIMDLHRKGVFNMPTSEMETPPADFDGRVNIKDFYDSVTSQIICTGLLTSGRKNPFLVLPSYHNWAPWIGPKCRDGDIVFNTEHEKLHAPRQAAEMSDLQMTEERLQDALINLRVDMVRKLCKQCGIDSKGSKMDLILRLREEMKNRSSYDKIFEKVWGASGGWAVVMCPCAVVYSIKFNLRAESPRDYADILLSWKHFPNIAIYDFARGLATHTNLREPENLPFSPHEGRLAEASNDNVKSAAEGKLKVHLPWLKSKKKDADTNCHPLTGSSEHYTLYDVFHEKNTKDPRDILRRIALVPELAGWVNSQCAEQLFADMRKNNYFLNTLTPSEHIFMMRNILHHYNTQCNNKTEESIKKVVSEDVLQLDHNGQIVMAAQPPTEADVTTQPYCPSMSDLLPGLTPNQTSDQLNRRIWAVNPLPAQQKLLAYVLDKNKDPYEDILSYSPGRTLTRCDFWSLAFEEVEAQIADQCFQVITALGASQVSLFLFCVVLLSLWQGGLVALRRNFSLLMEFVTGFTQYIFPTFSKKNCSTTSFCLFRAKTSTLSASIWWLPGYHHFTMIPLQLYLVLANHISPGHWNTVTLSQLKGAPLQWGGNDCGAYMMMYALYVTLDMPFDFAQSDMPVIRSWWCQQLLKTFPLAGQFSPPEPEMMEVTQGEPTPTEPDTMEVTQRKEIQDVPVMRGIMVAWNWVKENQKHFAGKVIPPDIISMDEDDAAMAITMQELFMTTHDMDRDEDEIRSPFIFTFSNKDDMEFFMHEIRDKRDIRVSCMCNTD